MSTDLAAVRARLPAGLGVREATTGDLERLVEFSNRYASPAQWQSPEVARQFESAMPEPNRLWLMVEDQRGELVATARIGNGGIFASADGSWRGAIRVAPEWRRRDLATALLERLEAHAGANGARKVVGAVRGNEPEGRKFAEARGYAVFHERIDSYVDVQSFDATAHPDPEKLAGTAGVVLLTYEDLARQRADRLDDLHRDLWDLNWELSRDVPAPVPMPRDPPPLDDRMRKVFFDGPAMDHPTSVVALRGERPIAITITSVKENGIAYTNFTGVRRDERGKGIATAMKLRVLRVLRERGIRSFGTTNDEQNAAMRGINDRLGYRPDPPTLMVQKVLVA